MLLLLIFHYLLQFIILFLLLYIISLNLVNTLRIEKFYSLANNDNFKFSIVKKKSAFDDEKRTNEKEKQHKE